MQRYVGFSSPRSKDTISTKGIANPGLSLSREKHDAAYSALGSSDAAASAFGSSCVGGASAWPAAAGGSASDEVQRVYTELAYAANCLGDIGHVPGCHGGAA
jgi:hypothetical protein